MSEAMKVVPEAQPIRSGEKDVAPVVAALKQSLADTYRLLFKTHACHWNVEGPMFHTIHVLTEEQYNDLFAAADEIAERIRALGQLAPMAMSEIIEASVVKDFAKAPSAQAMVEGLAKDHGAIARRLHALIDVAEKQSDPVTADLATGRLAFHEKAAWMLHATAK